MESEAYKREGIKSELQELEQKIARIQSGAEKPLKGESLESLNAKYEQLQAQLGEHQELDQAA